MIFSAHYDHLGVGHPNEKGDSIYNGANDDASGTTAVLTLADYFAKKRSNERTIVFAAFTAEEIGEYGSQYFSGQFDPKTVVAMFNIEMIGTESKWGTNSAFITGFERSDMGTILQKNLSGSSFAFYPDPYPNQQLFYRSDNATDSAGATWQHLDDPEHQFGYINCLAGDQNQYGRIYLGTSGRGIVYGDPQ